MGPLVLFGLDGGYSITVLAALHEAGLTPSLVIHGRERQKRAPVLRHWPARPSGVARFLAEAEALLGPRVDAAGSDLAQAAHALGIDVLSTTQAAHPSVMRTLRGLAPDLFVIAGFSQLLRPEVLALAAKGGLNLHPGRLPEERGPAPLFWALKAGRTELAWTLHRLDAGEDSGDVVASGTVRAEPGSPGPELLMDLATAGSPALVAAVRALDAGTLVAVPQPQVGQGRCPRPTLADRRVDPARPAVEVFAFVAGCAGRYGLWAEVANDRFFIQKAVGYDESARLDYEFVLLGDRLLLACQPGIIELELTEDGAIFSAEYQE